MKRETGERSGRLAASVGIDWASDHHDIALQAAGARTIETSRLAHTPEAIAQWLRTVAARFGGRPVGIAIETSRGPLVGALLEAPWVVLYPVNPRSLRRFREVFAPNGAKDDVPDARLLLELLHKHRPQLHAWQPEAETTRRLQHLVERRRAVVALRTQLTLQLQTALKEYFPQALVWTGDDLTAPMATDFLAQWPTLAALQRARPATVRRFYTQHGARRPALLERRLAEIAAATPLLCDRAVIESGVLYVQLLAKQLAALGPSLAHLEATIAALFATHPDAALFASFPGAGAALAPRLLVAFGTDRRRYPSAAAMQTHTGVAPITVRSGRQCQVCWRWMTTTFLRQTFVEFAHHSRRHAPWARAFYAQQRQRGHSHHAAIRALAFKWIRILWRCWQDHTPYDGARYERALHLRHSPVSRLLPAHAA